MISGIVHSFSDFSIIFYNFSLFSKVSDVFLNFDNVFSFLLSVPRMQGMTPAMMNLAANQVSFRFTQFC
jgi:hypothetical protein